MEEIHFTIYNTVIRKKTYRIYDVLVYVIYVEQEEDIS